MDLLATIRDEWGWTGLVPKQIIGDNPFGNVISEDTSGKFWRICPEDLRCEVIAEDRAALEQLLLDQEFLHDWYAERLVEAAREQLGPLRPGYRYALTTPAPLGGEYGGKNLTMLPLAELVGVTGSIARQIAPLSDGSRVRLIVSN